MYKAITKDSVEEKILEMQQRKLDLVKNIIVVEDGIFKALDRRIYLLCSGSKSILKNLLKRLSQRGLLHLSQLIHTAKIQNLP